jgi:hypothetical protein
LTLPGLLQRMRTSPCGFPGRITFAERDQRSDALEQEIAAGLWRWAFLSPDAREELAANRSDLSLAIEYYLGGVFQVIDFTRFRGIWCDGVLELCVEKITRCSFMVTGISFSPSLLAPFEIEFHFSRRRDTDPVRTIIRFGDRDTDGEIYWHRNSANAATIVANRPKRNRDWAVAVELTPQE